MVTERKIFCSRNVQTLLGVFGSQRPLDTTASHSSTTVVFVSFFSHSLPKKCFLKARCVSPSTSQFVFQRVSAVFER